LVHFKFLFCISVGWNIYSMIKIVGMRRNVIVLRKQSGLVSFTK
jgi:hypothetical protein